jgi:NNP family nitrate/nitrite transporter-like MFS transporter
MNLRNFRHAGHLPTLFSAFLYFDVSFMIWMLIGALSAGIALDFWPVPEGVEVKVHLKNISGLVGLMTAVPVLGGAVLRLVLGVMTDHLGAKKTGLIGMALTAIPLLLGWLWANNLPEMLLVGLLLGVAGASFAAALPLASRWYPPQYQGLAMGIAGAGNSGTALATLFGPMLAKSGLGWHGVFGVALIPLALTMLCFALLAKDSPDQPPPKSWKAYGAVLRQADGWWFCLFYSATFGGFVGLASFLNAFFKFQYFPTDEATGAQYAGVFTTLCVISGSFLRPVGGYIADRWGGVRVLLLFYLGVAACVLLLGGALALSALELVPPPPLALAVALLFVTMGLLGMGNGSVFQLVPLRFPKEIGVITGIVGAAGGIGGFVLPNLIGGLKTVTGTFGTGLLVFAGISFVCWGLLRVVRGRWEATFLPRRLPLCPPLAALPAACGEASHAPGPLAKPLPAVR